jgi:hypothetical protein
LDSASIAELATPSRLCVLANARAIDGVADRPMEGARVALQDGKIVSIDAGGEVPGGVCRTGFGPTRRWRRGRPR